MQRVFEIETYKALAMLGLMRAREITPDLARIETRLETLTESMATSVTAAEDSLAQLLAIGAEIESLTSKTSYRFSATKAYGDLVHARIEVLREARFEGRQTLAEFMARRFDPSMRTVASTAARISAMAQRTVRAGDLLRTHVDVERSAQNQALLKSMDRRANLQLRLQETVEGLSVVAISYYAVNLASYLLYPPVSEFGMSKPVLSAVLTPVVILAVWFSVRRIKRSVE